jgi:hypothetical protein
MFLGLHKDTDVVCITKEKYIPENEGYIYVEDDVLDTKTESEVLSLITSAEKESTKDSRYIAFDNTN